MQALMGLVITLYIMHFEVQTLFSFAVDYGPYDSHVNLNQQGRRALFTR